MSYLKIFIDDGLVSGILFSSICGKILQCINLLDAFYEKIIELPETREIWRPPIIAESSGLQPGNSLVFQTRW